MTHKERTRARILDEAAQAMREHGHAGIGVASLMKRAGLTHGGFYAHFSDRNDLVAAAIDRMFEDSASMLARHLEQDDARGGLASLIDYYLSDSHRERVAKGCPIAALGSEAGRLPSAARERFEAGLERFQAAISKALRNLGFSDPDEQASSTVAEMVGALMLARATRDARTAGLMLAHSRERLKQRLGLIAAH
jgi:TetR/AcrR family transcriptional repressor of nem operon